MFSGDKLTFYPNGGEPETPDVFTKMADTGINITNASGYYNELRYFIDCIAEDKAPSVVKGDELLTAAALAAGK